MKRGLNKTLLIAVLGIAIFGLLMIYSASFVWSEFKFHNPYHFVIMQGIFFLVGLVLMFALAKIDYHVYYKYANIILIVCAILLMLVLIPGIGSVGLVLVL